MHGSTSVPRHLLKPQFLTNEEKGFGFRSCLSAAAKAAASNEDSPSCRRTSHPAVSGEASLRDGKKYVGSVAEDVRRTPLGEKSRDLAAFVVSIRRFMHDDVRGAAGADGLPREIRMAGDGTKRG